MLRETIAQLKDNKTEEMLEKEAFSPQVNIGVSVLIPETYISDLALRLGLYRRIAGLKSREELELFEEEMINRFGPIPNETRQLLLIINLKQKCFKANIEKIDVGPKGFVVTFRNNQHHDPTKLLQYVIQNQKIMKIRPDNKLVFAIEFKDDLHKVKVIEGYIDRLCDL
jgi:transcription-repair coupling factor (superfamily II helicase)